MRALGRTASTLAAAAAFVISVANDLEAANGRDVSAGYVWWDTADGATVGPGFFDGTVTTLNPPDDGAPVPVPLPWMFPYYGSMRGQAWISDNGWISFQDPAGQSLPTPDALPSAAAPPEILAVYWGDLDASNAALGTSIRHGEVMAAGAYRIQYSALDVASGSPALLDLYLFQDGRIKVQYRSIPGFAGKTAGLQDATLADGFAVVDQGAVAPGVPDQPSADYVIDVLPPPLLLGECSLVPALGCGSTTINESLPGTLPANIAVYGCDADAHWARERVHALTVTQATRLQAALTPGTGVDLVMHLVSQCSERECIAGPATSLDVVLGPGTYYLSIDAPFVADEGSYTLQVDCAPIGTRITCGDLLNDDTTGGTQLLFRAPCSEPLVHSGPERIYSLLVAAPNSVRAALTAAPDLDVSLYRVPADAALSGADCLQWDDQAIVLGGLPAGEYLVAVDGVNGAQGAFTLDTSCTVDLQCTIQGTADFGLGPRHSVSGDTTLGRSDVDRYECDRGLVLDGAELVYELVLPRPGQVAIRELGLPSGASFFVLDDCNEGTCRGDVSGSCGPGELPAGTHYLVVDSPAGLEGPFDLELVFGDTFGHWSDCEDLQVAPPPSPLPTVDTAWNFSDGAYCHQDPASINYPDGCTFAMYVAIRCGTAFHVPLFDVESGHVRVFDVFRDQYVDLTALSTSGWSDTGTDISWMDCVGDNPSWNDQTTDVFFESMDGLCGVYRLEFPQHSGFVWDLYANCTGDTTEEYPIHDSLCGALAAFDPLPDVYLAAADLDDSNCPDFTASYSVVNDGCVEAIGVEVAVLDAGVPVVIEVIPVILPGETVSGAVAGTFPGGMSSTSVTVEVDPNDTIVECSEVPGAGCVSSRVDALTVPNCSTQCQVMPSAFAIPSPACNGGPVAVDASGSGFANCPTGMLEYQLRWPGGTRPWQANPVFSGLMPAASIDYDVDVRCTDPALQATCVETTTVSVDVDWHPDFDAASVVGVVSECNQVQVVWSPAIFRGPTGTGVYNVLRSTVSCADAVDPTSLTRTLLATTTTTFHLDVTAVAGQLYFYVVEAEDDTPSTSGCQPTGFNVGGLATRVDVQGGACMGIIEQLDGDPALLPRVGTTLRLGWPDTYSANAAPLRWGTSSPIDVVAGEHFHVLRSDRPDGGFLQVNVPDPPRLQAGSFLDSAAAAPPGTPVWYYLVFASTNCHQDNRARDRFTTP